MPPRTSVPFYRNRKVLMPLSLAAPLLVLAGLGWLVTEVLLAPGVPDANTPPADVARFIMHEKGLPRLSTAEFEAFLAVQLPRLRDDGAFRERFLAEIRTSSPEEQALFREHLFDAMKPIVMRDIETYSQLEESQRQAFLDERIVAYNRVNKAWGSTTISKGMLGPAAMSPKEAVGFLMDKTTQHEREMAVAYGQALATRVEAILADPDLKAAIQARIDAPGAAF